MQQMRTLSAVTMAALILGSSAMADTLRVAHESSSDSLINLAIEHFAQVLSEKTNGELTVQIFPDGQLGDEASIADAVGSGSVDIGLGGVSDAIDPKLGVVTLPFLFDDLDAAHAFLDGPVGSEIFDTGAENGFHMLGALDSGFRQFALNGGPVERPEDLKGVKIRVPPIPVLLATLDAFGALPQSIPFGEVYTALQSGMVDGTEPEIRDFADQKWYEVTKYLSIANYVWTPNYWFMSLDRYDALTDEERASVDAAADETVIWYRGQLAAVYAEVEATLKEEGVTINTVDPAPFREMVGPVYDEFAKEWGADVVARVRDAASVE